MQVNVEFLAEVRKAIAEAPSERFTMASVCCRTGYGGFMRPAGPASLLAEDCGTAGCIAGWTLAIGLTRGLCEPCDSMSVAAQLLRLNADEESYMFFGLWAEHNLNDITKAETLAYLDRVIATGEVRLLRFAPTPSNS